MATAIIPVGPASVYLSRLGGIGKLIAESTGSKEIWEEFSGSRLRGRPRAGPRPVRNPIAKRSKNTSPAKAGGAALVHRRWRFDPSEDRS